MPRAFLQPGRAGQLQVALPGVSRARYVTGQQEPCAPCAAAGVCRQGVSRDGAGSAPLCMSCWRGREQRRARATQAEDDRLLWESIGELDAVAALEEACAACGEVDASRACWLCGYAWLRQARERFEADQADAAATVEAEFERIAAVSEAEARVADLTGWIERLRVTVHAYEAGFGGRAVELLADLLARLEAEAAGRATRRGRPAVTPYVGAVLAVDADWRSGRRAMPGRDRTAWFLDCSDRAVYDAWQKVAAVKWATRIRVGGRNSLERRTETGRSNDRAEFDLVRPHRSGVPAAVRATFVPAALGLLGELMERAVTVLEREQAMLDEARARAGGWTDWPEQVRRTQLRAAVAQARDTVTDAFPALALTANICRSHPVSQGELLTSCSYWGLRFSPQIMIHSPGCGLRPHGRGEDGASLSSTRRRSGDLDGAGCGSPPLRHPRTRKGVSCRSPRRTAPPWAAWAPQLARDLVVVWPWVARMPRSWAQAVLGSQLGPDWTAAQLARWVAQQRARPVLDDPAAPAAYLRTVLAETFTGDVEPPHQARRHTEHRRHVAAAAGVAQRAGHERLRVEMDARDAAAAAATGAGRSAARAELDRITSRRRPAVSLADCQWPEVTAPGSGARPPGSVLFGR